jgi:ubiquinone/menaquinone biosynthesis C-methylase UbiE
MSSFDPVAASYSEQVGNAVSFSGFGFEYFVQKKVDHLKAFVFDCFHGKMQGRTSLDIGAGEGQYSLGLQSLGLAATLTDISPEFLEVARKKSGIQDCVVADASSLPFPDASRDVIVLAMVLHHIPVEKWSAIFAECHRVLKPGGLAAIYEHNPWNPLTRRVMASLPFDADANPRPLPNMRNHVRAAGFEIVLQEYLFFVPGVLRFLCPVEKFLAWCPAGAQYALIGRKRE